MSTQAGPTDAELAGIFGDVDQVGEAAQRIAAEMAAAPPPQEALPQQPQPAQQIQTVAPPPSEPVLTQEQKEINKYDSEKKKLFEVEEQLFKIAHSDQSGSIIRNFGLSQLIIKVGDEVDRLNGLLVLRALKAKCNEKSIKKVDGMKDEVTGTMREQLSSSMYEVWGLMDDGSLGLTSSYMPEMVLCVISLRSGYDMPPV